MAAKRHVKKVPLPKHTHSKPLTARELLAERRGPGGALNPATDAATALPRIASIIVRHRRFGFKAPPKVALDAAASPDEASAKIRLLVQVEGGVQPVSFRMSIRRDGARWRIGIGDGPVDHVLDLADWTTVSKVVNEARKELVK